MTGTINEEMVREIERKLCMYKHDVIMANDKKDWREADSCEAAIKAIAETLAIFGASFKFTGSFRDMNFGAKIIFND